MLRSLLTTRNLWPLLLAAVLTLAMVYVWQNRYFLRFVPLPVTLVEWVDGTSWLPGFQPYQPRGAAFFASGDLTADEGLRKTLDEIQRTSPTESATGSLPPTDFAGWAAWVRRSPFYCTDATQMFLLAASEQGLPAREWQLLLPGWIPGQGHSLAEFYNPRRQRWQVVDPQHGAILRDSRGEPASMAYVLRRFHDGRTAEIAVDYGPFEAAMRAGARGATVEEYLFGMALLSTSVLQLRQPTWFARVEGIGHPVIGYPVIVSGWTHDHRVWASKAAAMIALGAIVGLLVVVWRRRRGARVSGA